MLTANKLEKFMELEDSLRSEYQSKLDAKSAELERCRQELTDQRRPEAIQRDAGRMACRGTRPRRARCAATFRCATTKPGT